MKYRILSNTEQELFAANVLAIVDFNDLITMGASATGNVVLHPYTGGDGVVQPYTAVASPPTIAAGTVAKLMAMALITPFVFSDGSITSNAVTVGDGGSATKYMASKETLGTASFILYDAGTGTRNAYLTTDSIKAFFTCTATHNLSTATAGAIAFYLKVEDLTQLPLA